MNKKSIHQLSLCNLIRTAVSSFQTELEENQLCFVGSGTFWSLHLLLGVLVFCIISYLVWFLHGQVSILHLDGHDCRYFPAYRVQP